MLDGIERLERYRRIDDGKRSDYALIQLERVGVGTAGKVDLVWPLTIHSEKGGPARLVAVIGRSQHLVGKVCRAATTPKPISITRAKARRRYLLSCDDRVRGELRRFMPCSEIR